MRPSVILSFTFLVVAVALTAASVTFLVAFLLLGFKIPPGGQDLIVRFALCAGACGVVSLALSAAMK